MTTSKEAGMVSSGLASLLSTQIHKKVMDKLHSKSFWQHTKDILSNTSANAAVLGTAGAALNPILRPLSTGWNQYQASSNDGADSISLLDSIADAYTSQNVLENVLRGAAYYGAGGALAGGLSGSLKAMNYELPLDNLNRLSNLALLPFTAYAASDNTPRKYNDVVSYTESRLSPSLFDQVLNFI